MCGWTLQPYQILLLAATSVKMASGKKKQDEMNLKTLRELTALEHNKKCLECGQRGITYADMTTAGFVCVQCSGYL